MGASAAIWAPIVRASSSSAASCTARKRSRLSRKWWYRAPRVTFARCTISSVPTPAYPRSANSSRAAARSAVRVAPDCSALFARPSTAATLRQYLNTYSLYVECRGMETATVTPAQTTAAEQFVAFFEELWAVGGSDPERFFAMLAERTTPDALMSQPLAPPARGPAGQRQIFGPLFEAIPDLRGGRDPLGRHAGRRAA